MERAFGSDPMSSGNINKSAVLTVKPLRCLAPIFPSQPDPSAPPSHQYASIPPMGPFPPGATPFFPFFAANDPQRPAQQRAFPIPSPVPLNSFKTPVSGNGDIGTSRRGSRNHTVVDEDGNSVSDGYDDGFERNMETGSEVNDKSRVTRRKVRSKSGIPVSSVDVAIESVAENMLKSFNLVEIDTFRQANSDKELVDRVLIVFNLLRRKITQLEERNAVPGVAKRPDLRAGTICMSKAVRANTKKRIGSVPGVEIGDIFFFRMELCLAGVHAPSMAGIDYMGVKVSGEDDSLAVSIVSSGGYEDEGDDGEVLIYSGQGGVQRKDKQSMDQQLVRGNLALEKSLHKSNEVRVIRGLKDFASPTGKVYVYDGLYKIHESWIEKGKSGCNIFKYKFVRVAGQPEAFTLWKSIQQWKDGVTTRPGIILPDLTSGAESLPVCLVNDVDGEKGPPYFSYTPTLKYTKPFPSMKPSVLNCDCCTGGCQSNTGCPCVQKNEGQIPYTSLGVLQSHNTLIHECGNMCICPVNCRNRISQAGLKMRLEVFKTKDKGWGLRSWDPIRSGSFICEYAGAVISEKGIDSEDNYIFDATRAFEPLEPEPSDEPVKFPFPLIISARNEGNVARFMNHSCSPNVYWQPIIRENQDESYFHVGFFAIKHIPPMQELTFDYGMLLAGKAGPRKKKCLCGSLKCKGVFY
ncbi:putative [histone H3]-lysine(4) N-trimethyltransferase chromatin remodeling SET family [Helianthus annuus]|uniref:Histone-lysine N-methyltransferase chromatin remodeling SET family n=1 Tax=Helianthus annuus TaxID=4232 RepID=A0A251TIH5_HELAN|nr:histone-lysine N-methyltransferase, H3 lysine-9 specific SUVH1 [Helianthus annuus]KAF5786000.1 putative histone-lysine N-methyltransferase chromatin remodeling SET family [Helianthus annuus]KAJ0521321.1 putative [histone H3]-lysine(4) N-trimethyltransferase chromatin remodeling SET family [Helianthus annuus]KAJ0742855.1 putative [histone H3]-lysine(4) N-trimethyltransferase chromatin remodeling SET family [Helianthus annuus]KAJ0883365.1 putative histone-lysine N-methyltransferase chromatin r